MLVMPGPPLRWKIGANGCDERARIRVTGSAIRRDRGSAAVLGHDERSAVGAVGAFLGGIGARVHGQLAGVRPLRDRDRGVAGCEPDVRKAEQHTPMTTRATIRLGV